MKTSLLHLPALAVSILFLSTLAGAAEPLVPVATPSLEEILASLPVITTVDAQTCVSNRGATLEIPSLAPGIATGPLVLKHNSLILLTVPAKRISSVRANDDKRFSLNAKDAKGNVVLRASGSLNSRQKYDVVIHRPNWGIMGFNCAPQKSAAKLHSWR